MLDHDNGSVDISTDDYTLDLDKWKLKVIYHTIESLMESPNNYQIFIIEFKDKCWDSILTPSQWLKSELEYDLHQDASFIFLPMKDESYGLDCGGYTYDIVYQSGSANPSLINSVFSIAAVGGYFAVEGVITDKNWVKMEN